MITYWTSKFVCIFFIYFSNESKKRKAMVIDAELRVEATLKQSGPLFLDQYSPLSGQKHTEGFKIPLFFSALELIISLVGL